MIFREILLLILQFILAVLLGCSRVEPAPSGPSGPEDAHHEHGHGAGDHQGEIRLTAEAVSRSGIKIEAASLWKLRPTFVAPARVAFNAEAVAHVGSPLPGRVVELPVRLGDRVQKGDVLVVVESPELGEAQSDFLSKQIAAQTVIATVDLAKNSLDRASRLYEENRGIALDEVQKREVEYKSAQASQQSARAAAMAAENKLHLLGMTQAAVDMLRETGEVHPRLALAAPIAGQVVEREVTLGELVHPEREALLVLADIDTLWVLADVPEARLPEVALGAPARINAGSLDPHQHEGQVSYIAPMIDPRTRTASVRIAVHCEDGSLRPGVFVLVEMTSTDRSSPDPAPVVAVPESAVQTIENQPVIFVPVAGEDNTFVRRSLVVGKPVAGLVPVLSGLVEGELFVSAGSFILKAELGKSTAEHVH